MSIQSLSVCVPAKRCINDCKFCCSKMHTADYEDRFGDAKHYAHYSEDLRKRLEYARENGFDTDVINGRQVYHWIYLNDPRRTAPETSRRR